MKLNSLLLLVLTCAFAFSKGEEDEFLHLKINEHATLNIDASIPLFGSGISVSKGEIYLIQASGKWADNGFEATDADGFKGFTFAMKAGAILKRMSKENYMMLCGKVKGQKFPIGAEATIKIRRNGTLKLFANDARFFFGNNKGTLKVTIKRIE